MSEIRIPYALDPKGQLVDIQKARHKLKYYRCIKCRSFLEPRQGETREWYFAHEKLDNISRQCPLRTKKDVEELIKEFRTSPVEILESKKQIRLVLIQNPYTNTIKLFGILPVLQWEDLNSPIEVDNILKSIFFDGVGIKGPLQPRIFHPSEPEAKIELDPYAKNYELKISTKNSKYKSLSLIGDWKADSISIKNIFSGEESYRVERRSNNSHIKNGDTVFIFLKENFKEKINGCENLSLGPWKIIKFEVNDVNKKISSRFIEVSEEKDNFYVDIILPSYVSPYSESPIPGNPESKSLIAVIPPLDEDPEFEIVSVPLGKENRKLESKGRGVPRIFEHHFPTKGSSRVSVHRGNEHRLISFYVEDRKHPQKPWKEDMQLGIELETEGETKRISPWSNDGEIIIESKKLRENKIHLNLLGPEEFKIDLKAIFYKNQRLISDIALKKAAPILNSWLKEDFINIILDYDSLGKIELNYYAENGKSSQKPWKEDIQLGLELKTEGEIKKVSPWSNEGVTIIESEKLRESKIELNLIGPEELKIDVRGTSRRKRRSVYDVVLKRVESILNSWIKADFTCIVLDYDSLGRIEIDVQQPTSWKDRLSDIEVERRLKNFGELPKKANWSTIRRVYGAPFGTPHNELPDGIKKQVRKILMKLRKEHERQQYL